MMRSTLAAVVDASAPRSIIVAYFIIDLMSSFESRDVNDMFYSSPLTKALARFAHKAFVEKKKKHSGVGDDDETTRSSLKRDNTA